MIQLIPVTDIDNNTTYINPATITRLSRYELAGHPACTLLEHTVSAQATASILLSGHLYDVAATINDRIRSIHLGPYHAANDYPSTFTELSQQNKMFKADPESFPKYDTPHDPPHEP